MMDKLTGLYKWFDENRLKIITGHSKEVVLLHDNSVIGYYSSVKEALESANSKKLKVGDFLVQECITQEEDCMMYYNQAVCFG